MNRGKYKKRKTPRYGKYYEKKMEPIWRARWEKNLNRVKKLKKEILALGEVPTKEVQLIKTINYFIKLVDLLTDFYDKGTLTVAPDNKKQVANDFNFTIEAFVSREKCLFCYINKSEVGKRVTANNLYLGNFSPITEDEDLSNIPTIEINGEIFKIKTDFTPLSKWLNGKAKTINGYPVKIEQKKFADLVRHIRELILETINLVLEE